MAKKKVLWLKDTKIPALIPYEGQGVNYGPHVKKMMSDKWKEEWAEGMDLDKVIKIAECFNKHYDEIEKELREIGGEDTGEALYEDLEDNVAGAFGEIVIKWVAVVRPDLLDIKD